MPEHPIECLIVLESGAAIEALASVHRMATVTQVFAPRMVLVQFQAGLEERLGAVPGVIRVLSNGELALPEDLTFAERAFASAWAARFEFKARVGEDADWDSPGLIAPDLRNDQDE